MADESVVEVTMCNWAEQEGYVVRKVRWVGRRGAADRLFARDGVLRLIEFKDPDGKLSTLQKREIEKFEEVGVSVSVIDNVRDGCILLGLRWPR